MSEEQKRVRKFYKTFLSWKAENIGMWIGAGFLEILFAISMMIPLQEIVYEPGLVTFPFLLSVLGAMLYIRPYQVFVEERQETSIYEKIKYLPIDIAEIRKMRVVYLVSFVGKIFPIVLILQLLFAHWYFEITLGNVIYAVIMGVVLPIIGNLPGALSGK